MKIQKRPLLGQALRNQGLWHLPTLLDRWPYVLAARVEAVDGVQCQVAEANLECSVPVNGEAGRKRVLDKLWLDLEHGLALRKRELRMGLRLDRVTNAHFVRVAPGLWLPRQSRTETFLLRETSSAPTDAPLVRTQMTLCFWLANQVPDELFDVVLTPPKERRAGVLDVIRQR